ncbi:hypothetical protein JW823_01930 [bacterium]|nr:hypothetical protein [candidate division CSSED10-310 bacterium]
MNQIVKGFINGFLVLVCISSTMAIDPKQVTDDWALMDSLLTERDFFLYQSEFDKNPEAFAAKWLPFADTFRKKEDEFSTRYGTDRNTWMTTFEGAVKPEGAKREYYSIVNEFLAADIDGMHRNIVGWAESSGSEQYGNWERLADPDPKQVELRHRYAARALTAYRVAAKLSPEKDYGDILDKCEAAERDTKKQFLDILKDLSWPGNNPDFEGPGKPKELAGAALEFLRDHPTWSKPEYDDVHVPYAACVSGKGWEVWKRNKLTENPTQYSLDILVAFTGEKDPDIVYVYSMVFYTAEEDGVKKELPFIYASSKQYQKYQMLKSSVPEGVSSKKGKQSKSGTAATGTGSTDRTGSKGSSTFGAWRLLFSLVLICGGCLGAAPWLTLKIPASKSFLEKIKGMALPFGFGLLVMGLLGFMGNLFRFVPHASCLPQASAVLLGVILIRKTPGLIPADIAQKLRILEQYEVMSGLAAIVLGILHLIAGGLPLL